MGMIKHEYIDSFVAVVKDGVTVSCRLGDATPEQLAIVREVFPEYFEKVKPEKAKPND